MRRDSFMCEASLVRIGDMTHAYTCLGVFVYVAYLIHTYGSEVEAV